MPALIREYCCSKPDLRGPPELCTELINFYTTFILSHSDPTTPTSHPIVLPEMPNIYHILAVSGPTRVAHSTIQAVIVYSSWMLYLRAPSVQLLRQRLDHNSVVGARRGDCYRALGHAFNCLNRPDCAKEYFNHAEHLHSASRRRGSEAEDHMALGHVFTRTGRLEDAVQAYRHAYDSYEAAMDDDGKAESLAGGSVRRRGKL